MEGQSSFPVVLLAPGSARLMGHSKALSGSCCEPKWPHVPRHCVTLCPCRALRAPPGLCPESVGTVGLTGFGLPVQPSSWALKEAARSVQGLEKPPLHLGFGGEALEDGAAQPQQNTDETAHPDGPKPFRFHCSGKFILLRCFHVVGLFPPLSLVLKLA